MEPLARALPKSSGVIRLGRGSVGNSRGTDAGVSLYRHAWPIAELSGNVRPSADDFDRAQQEKRIFPIAKIIRSEKGSYRVGTGLGLFQST